MQIPLQVTFRNMEPSEVMENRIRERAEKLDQYYERLMSCRVVVEASHRHHRKGNLYHVRIDMTVPDGELVISKKSHDKHAHEDAYVAIRDAFNAAERQLEEHGRRRQGEVKTHPVPPHGRVIQLNLEQDFGIIQAMDGREIYFHRNSLINADFDKLDIGTEVRFAEAMGDKGPQASTVQVEGKHHIVDRPTA